MPSENNLNNKQETKISITKSIEEAYTQSFLPMLREIKQLEQEVEDSIQKSSSEENDKQYLQEIKNSLLDLTTSENEIKISLDKVSLSLQNFMDDNKRDTVDDAMQAIIEFYVSIENKRLALIEKITTATIKEAQRFNQPT